LSGRIHGEVTKPNLSCRKKSLCKGETHFGGNGMESFNKIFIKEIHLINLVVSSSGVKSYTNLEKHYGGGAKIIA
jgi:hypothetical protein